MKKLLTTIILLASVCPLSASAMTLFGEVEQSAVYERPQNVEGHIGVRISRAGNIALVHKGSPADLAGLKRGDTVIRVDGNKHSIDAISGPAGTTVHLAVRRLFHVFEVDVERKDVREIPLN